MEKSELVIVDLGNLSQTQFGKSVLSARIQSNGDSKQLSIETGVLSKSFDLSHTAPVGTFIVTSLDGSIAGIAREEYILKSSY